MAPDYRPVLAHRPSPQVVRDGASSRLQREAQEGLCGPRTRDSYGSLSISNDPVGDRVAGMWLKQERKAYEYRQMGLVVDFALQVAAEGDPADFDYRLASLVAFANTCLLPKGFVAGLERGIQCLFPTLLESGFAKRAEEVERKKQESERKKKERKAKAEGAANARWQKKAA